MMAALSADPVVHAPRPNLRTWWSVWAEENRDWGYRRILGAMSNLGHNLARGTIANILKKHGIEPAPDRIRKTTWKEFLSQHVGGGQRVYHFGGLCSAGPRADGGGRWELVSGERRPGG